MATTITPHPKQLKYHPDRYFTQNNNWGIRLGEGVTPLTLPFGKSIPLTPVLEADGIIIKVRDLFLCSPQTKVDVENTANPHYDTKENGKVLGFTMGKTVPIFEINIDNLVISGNTRDRVNIYAGVKSVDYIYESDIVSGLPKNLISQINYTLNPKHDRPEDGFCIWDLKPTGDYSVAKLTEDTKQTPGAKLDPERLRTYINGVKAKLAIIRKDNNRIKDVFYGGWAPADVQWACQQRRAVNDDLIYGTKGNYSYASIDIDDLPPPAPNTPPPAFQRPSGLRNAILAHQFSSTDVQGEYIRFSNSFTDAITAIRMGRYFAGFEVQYADLNIGSTVWDGWAENRPELIPDGYYLEESTGYKRVIQVERGRVHGFQTDTTTTTTTCCCNTTTTTTAPPTTVAPTTLPPTTKPPTTQAPTTAAPTTAAPTTQPPAVANPFSGGGCITGKAYRIPKNDPRYLIGTQLYNAYGYLWDKVMPDSIVNTLPVETTVTIPNFNIPWQVFSVGLPGKPDLKDYFGIKFTGWINIPTTGKYGFDLHSDDGSRLNIYRDESHEVTLLSLNNLGQHPMNDPDELARGIKQTSGQYAHYDGPKTVTLSAGVYPFVLDYNQVEGSNLGLRLYWKPMMGSNSGTGYTISDPWVLVPPANFLCGPAATTTTSTTTTTTTRANSGAKWFWQASGVISQSPPPVGAKLRFTNITGQVITINYDNTRYSNKGFICTLPGTVPVWIDWTGGYVTNGSDTYGANYINANNRTCTTVDNTI